MSVVSRVLSDSVQLTSQNDTLADSAQKVGLNPDIRRTVQFGIKTITSKLERREQRI